MRTYAADDVFGELAREIMRGDLEPGQPLPPERVLSERFGVSKLLVRQAIHRLAQAELVRVRQGDVTKVLDPAASSSIAVIELYYRLPSETRSITPHVLEKQYTQGLSMIEVFARRALPERRAELVTLVREAKVDSEASLSELETRFWTHVATAGGNCILRTEAAFWYRALESRPKMPGRRSVTDALAFYTELARRLKADDDPVAFYVKALAPGVDALFTRPRPKSRTP